MPVYRCSNGRYRIGDGKCIYPTKASAERAYKGYLASRYMNKETVMKKVQDIIKNVFNKLKGHNETDKIIETQPVSKATLSIYLGTVALEKKDENILYIGQGETADIDWNYRISLPLPSNSVSKVNGNTTLRWGRAGINLMNEVHRVLQVGGMATFVVGKQKKIIPPELDSMDWAPSTFSFYINDALRRAQSIYPKFELVNVESDNYDTLVTLKKVKSGVIKERGEGQGQGGSKQGDSGADKCICPKCDIVVKHEKGTPCTNIKCPECGATMIGKSEESVKKHAKFVEIIKTNDELQMVYGVVFQPDTEDSDGDVVSADEIEKAMHGFMKSEPKFDVGHDLDIRYDVALIENYIAPNDMVCKFNKKERDIKKGSWIMGVRVGDELWKEVKSGKINGFSPWGTALREHNIDEGDDNE